MPMHFPVHPSVSALLHIAIVPAVVASISREWNLLVLLHSILASIPIVLNDALTISNKLTGRGVYLADHGRGWKNLPPQCATPPAAPPSTSSPTRMLTLQGACTVHTLLSSIFPNAVRNDPRSPKREAALAKVVPHTDFCRARSLGSPVRPGPVLDALDEEHGSLLDPAGLCERD